MKDTDRDIIHRLRKSATKEQAFNELVKAYQKPLYAHLRRMAGNHQDADDLLQNTFLKVWRHAESFKGASAIYTWVYRIATNEALGFLRKQSESGLTALNEDMHAATATDGPTGDDISLKLQNALLTLPAKQRQVFDLHYFQELKYEEIATITGTSVGALKASYFHAVKKIEAFITA